MEGLHRGFRPHLSALDKHLPGGERDDSGHDLGQGRFAGAVLTNQRVDLARKKCKVDVLYGGNPGIFLCRLPQLDNRPVMAAGLALFFLLLKNPNPK